MHHYTSEASDLSHLMHAYKAAKSFVIKAGFAAEIAWQDSLLFTDIIEADFLRENAWVVLCCGMRESIIRNRFQKISECFRMWQSANEIVRNEHDCRKKALQCFNHPAKINAIIETSRRIDSQGFGSFKSALKSDSLGVLRSLPFIGPVTSYHLAKNIGIPVAKPDRHLVRIANLMGYKDVQVLCDEISRISGDSVPVVDVILWRFAAIQPNYLGILGQKLI